MSPYCLHLLQTLKEDDKVKRINFCCGIHNHIENDDFLPHVMFSDESVFHLSRNVNHHNVHICGTEVPHVGIEHKRDLPKMSVFVLHHTSGHAFEVALPSATRRC
jgi:hypothetical protein